MAKPSYRIGRRWKGSQYARLNYITYLQEAKPKPAVNDDEQVGITDSQGNFITDSQGNNISGAM